MQTIQSSTTATSLTASASVGASNEQKKEGSTSSNASSKNDASDEMATMIKHFSDLISTVGLGEHVKILTSYERQSSAYFGIGTLIVRESNF